MKGVASIEINWNEINLILQERSSKASYMVQPNEMNNEDYSKIVFLLNEIDRFPDNQKTVAESGANLNKYLSEKYRDLSTDSINRLVTRFCFVNR
ncbi:hypothetical protein GCM10008018_45160 [Paenibacillus marchantiophytorum]|uniref:Uncharacterized protein n=1 Tax=Paenibacillus marchantiophytorum TaxID=1619310 RepID=A0ABQ1EYY0_9BACL|nr:hypothetical protein [Paenibacillus marchantiophytorum]GFZ93739.1 hypothetical protein GCM10008018_45160 [Paenibacillus marchantiophytorum]